MKIDKRRPLSFGHRRQTPCKRICRPGCHSFVVMLNELRRQGRFQEALEEAERLLSAHFSPALACQRADLLARLKRPEEALQQLEALPQADLKDVALALKAGLLQHFDRQDEAEVLFEELAQRPHLEPAVQRRVVEYLQKKDPVRAVHLAQRGEGAPAALLQAETLEKEGRKEEALQVLARAVERYPAHDGLFKQWVMLRLEDQEPAVVVEQLDLLLSMDRHRHNLALRERLVQALRATGELDRARLELLKCLEQSGNQHYLRANLAYVLRDLGQIDSALDLMEQLLHEDPGDSFVLGAYFKACRDHDRKQRAASFVASSAQVDARLRRWWGTFRKVFKE